MWFVCTQNQIFGLHVIHSAYSVNARHAFLCPLSTLSITILLSFAFFVTFLYLDSEDFLWYYKFIFLKTWKMIYNLSKVWTSFDSFQTLQNILALWKMETLSQSYLSFISWSLLDQLCNWTLHVGLLITTFQMLEEWLGNLTIPSYWQVLPRSLEVPCSLNFFPLVLM